MVFLEVFQETIQVQLKFCSLKGTGDTWIKKKSCSDFQEYINKSENYSI